MKQEMKTIGMIGGMSWQSSKVYYEYINEIVGDRLGGSHNAKSMMATVDFAEIEKFSFQGDWDRIGDIMADNAKKLERAGADMVILCTNTIHLVSNFITEAVNLPFLHIADATGSAIAEERLKKVGLLGTKFTMEKDFYTKKLEETYNLEVLVPVAGERQVLQDIIYKELVLGKFAEASKQICIEQIKNLVARGAEGVILGCTELPILVPDSEVDVPTFNTTRIHAEKAVDFALAN